MKKSSPRRAALPAKPSLDHLRKQAKKRAKENPSLKLAEAQHQLAKEYGFKNWAELAREAESLARGAGSKAALYTAILKHDAAEVNRLLEQWPMLLDVDLWPVAMFQAASPAITRLLLACGLDPNRCSAPRKPLHFASEKGWPEIIEELLRCGADPDIRDGEGFTPLDLLGTWRTTEVSQRCIQILRVAGAEVSVWTAIRVGDSDRALDLLTEALELLDAPSPDLGFTPLQTAARAADLRVMQWLLDRGADVNARNPMGNTPLWFACQSGEDPGARLKAARMLIAAGADVGIRCEEGSTALSYAAWRGPAAMVELLLSHGAEATANDRGERPMDYARRGPNASERNEIVRLLGGETLNVISDSSFATLGRPGSHWEIESHDSVTHRITVADGVVQVEQAGNSGVGWHGELRYAPFPVRKGDVFDVSFLAHFSRPTRFSVWIGQYRTPWHSLVAEENRFDDRELGPEWMGFAFRAEIVADEPEARLNFVFGWEDGVFSLRDVAMRRTA